MRGEEIDEGVVKVEEIGVEVIGVGELEVLGDVGEEDGDWCR